MVQHYGADYDRSVGGAGEDSERWRGRHDTLLRHKSGGAVLDMGCSSGGFLSSLKGPLWQRYGIEMSGGVATVAQAKCRAQVFIGDILDAPFPPSSFDAITCFHVFEHLYQPREVLEKVWEWLKPDGVFYTMMPNIDSGGARIFGSYWYALELPRHLYHFSPESLIHLANSIGLQEVSLTTHREVFVEASVRYMLDDAFERLGMPRVPLAQAKPASVPWRIVRKAFRLTVLPLLAGLASFAGDGESIHAVFRKDLSRPARLHMV
jgi:SAM-dependent methyltransferase